MRMIARCLAALGLALLYSGFAAAESTWERYLSNPTGANAMAVSDAGYGDNQNDVARLEWDLTLLEVQVISSDKDAVDLAFRLLAKSDGHSAEMLNEMLGRLIRINPRLFLDALKRGQLPSGKFGDLVGNFGVVYVDRDRAHDYERDQRIAALMRVKTGSLSALRDQCIIHLRH